MRILGLDLGEKRVGAALSDELGMYAHPLGTLLVKGERDMVEQIAACARENGAELLVVGMPYDQEGKMGPQAERVSRWAEAVKAGTGLPLEYVDERMSSIEAGRALREAPKKVRRDKAAVDRLAAAIILQQYLDTVG